MYPWDMRGSGLHNVPRRLCSVCAGHAHLVPVALWHSMPPGTPGFSMLYTGEVEGFTCPHNYQCQCEVYSRYLIMQIYCAGSLFFNPRAAASRCELPTQAARLVATSSGWAFELPMCPNCLRTPFPKNALNNNSSQPFCASPGGTALACMRESAFLGRRLARANAS